MIGRVILTFCVLALAPLAAQLELRAVEPSAQIHISEISRCESATPSWRFRPDLPEPSKTKHFGLICDGVPVAGLVAEYAFQEEGSEAVSERAKLVSSEDVLKSKKSQVKLDGRSVLQTELGTGEDRSYVVWTWYSINGRWVASDLEAKLAEAASLLSLSRPLTVRFVLAFEVAPNSARLEHLPQQIWRSYHESRG